MAELVSTVAVLSARWLGRYSAFRYLPSQFGQDRCFSLFFLPSIGFQRSELLCQRTYRHLHSVSAHLNTYPPASDTRCG